jgi:TnpA family transposase
VQVTASLRNRVGSASTPDRVAKALMTLGRVAKTIYILRYIH